MWNKEMRRREFIEVVSKGAVAGFAAVQMFSSHAGAAESPGDELRLNLGEEANAVLLEAGGALYVAHEGAKKPLVVWRQDESYVKVFSSECTHRGCKLELPADGVMVCPCHKAQFDAAGKAIKGPAKKALKEFPADLLDGEIVVYLSGKRPDGTAVDGDSSATKKKKKEETPEGK